MLETTRLDKWLWAARFYKTRSLAQQAVTGGKVHYNHARVKPSHKVEIGAMLSLTLGIYKMEIRVCELAEKRGNAKFAQTLYEETATSRSQREVLREQRRLMNANNPRPQQKPDKKQRRHIIRFKRKDQSE